MVSGRAGTLIEIIVLNARLTWRSALIIVDFRRCHNNGDRTQEYHETEEEPDCAPESEVGLGQLGLALAARGRAQDDLVLVRVAGEALVLETEPPVAALARVADPREGARSDRLKLAVANLTLAGGGVAVAGDRFCVLV